MISSFITINSDVERASASISVLIGGGVVDCGGPWWEHTRLVGGRFTADDKRVIRGSGNSPGGNVGQVQIDGRWTHVVHWSFIICERE